MNILLFCLIEFLIAVILVLLYYKFIEVRKIKKYTKDNIPVDLKLFIQTQKINVKKISYKKLMKIVAITNAIDIGLVLVVTNVVDSMILKFVVAIPVIFIVLIGSYKLVGKVLKKKGMTLDESWKNRKKMAKILGRKWNF